MSIRWGKYPATKDTQNYNLTCLFNACGWQDFDSVTNVGFRKGGYLQSGVVLNANPDSSFQDNTKVNSSILANQTQILDAWGKPIVLQVLLTSQNCQSITGMNDCARLVSAGFDGVIETLISDTVNTPPELKRKGDDRIVYLNIPTPSGEQNTPCDQY